MKGTLSLWGLYQTDQTILDTLQLPEGLDADLAKTTILYECAELEILYPEPSFLKMLIEVWSKKELPTWQRFYNAALLEYNPIENYDRKEDWTENETGNRNVNSTSSAHSEGNTTGSTIHYVHGYNDVGQIVQSADQSSTVPETDATATDSGSESRTGSNTHSGRIHGNIGVTTSQQMLQSEIDIAPKLNTYNFIVESFKRRFCLLVYT